jgi:hypothetical protein
LKACTFAVVISFLYIIYDFVVVHHLAKRDNRVYKAVELAERAGAGTVQPEEPALSDGKVPGTNVKTVAFIHPAQVV